MEGKFDRRNRPQKEREIYRPGSGPLKRTDPVETKGYMSKNYCYEKINHTRSERDEFAISKNYDQQNDRSFDKDKKKPRKPDASIYVPKQRSKVDGSNQNESYEYNSSSCPPSSDFTFEQRNNEKMMIGKERFSNRDGEFSNQRHDANHGPSKIYIESRQFISGSRNDVSHNWKESAKENAADFRKFDGRETHDSILTNKGSFQNVSSSGSDDRNSSYQNEYKNSNFYNRYGSERNDRGNNGDKNQNRTGRSLSRRNSSNSLVIPDVFTLWPPRFQKQFLESKGMTPDEIEKYLKNENNFVANSNRDNRYSQTLPPKNSNRNFHFKLNKPKEVPKNNRAFQKSGKFHDNPCLDQSYHSQEKLSNIGKDATSLIEKSSPWNSRESVHEDEADILKNSPMTDSKSSEEKLPNSIEAKNVLDEDEVFNWAEEVEREQQIAEKNNSEIDERRKTDDTNTGDEKKERKKRRRREFRKKRGFSYERKNPQRNSNQSESENQSGDHYRQNDDNSYKERTTSTSNSDTYLSWRRNKNPSPSRTRLGIMTRNYRSDNKFDNMRNNTTEQERLSNKIKINNRINDLPIVIKEQANSDKDSVAGIIKIPPPQGNQSELKCSPPVFPVSHFSAFQNKPIKQLYNPTNPKHPILVSGQSARATVSAVPPLVSPNYTPPVLSEPPSQLYGPVYMDPSVTAIVAPAYVTEHCMMSKPAWYDAYSESFRSTHNAHLLLDISRADTELQALLSPTNVIPTWDRITDLRVFLQEALRTLLTSDLKFCEAENVEQHMWKILFYNVIELLRKCIVEDTINSQKFRILLFFVIDKGMDYFRSLLNLLERTYKIKIDEFCSVEPPATKPPGFGSLALISAQKIFLFLGDLARYRETTEESTTYTNARQWYVKANLLNPRNGRPYNQLAILAVYARRKFDAVYYYMRSLMASNPFFTARESLLALFDENRKKYEQIEKTRREIKEKKKQEKAKEKESVINGSMLRKETWIRPDDGKRMQRTTSTSLECKEESNDEELHRISPVEVNKRFLLSFLHVHGKLFSKVGMETLQEAAVEMLKEFKILLNYSPLPINTTRLLQLLALNMFAIDNGQLKDPQIESGYHSAIQESALVISLQMFNLIVNRCIQLLREQLQQMKNQPEHVDWHYPLIVSADVQILLPAIKLWCDWLFCHSAVWNPPPSCQDYRISGCGDCWSRLAVLINILEELDYQKVLAKNGFDEPILIMSDKKHDMVKISLEEDVTLRGFTPLICNAQQPVYTHKHVEMELAQICLRIHRILFFGTIFLCGIDPPVLKLQKTETGLSEYISVVEEVVTPKDQSDSENVYEQWSENEEENENEEHEFNVKGSQTSLEDKGLLSRKKELERIHQKREKYIRDKKETINKDIAAYNVEMEITPHYLVPDTNCFIDCLPELEKIAKAVSSSQRPLYSLMVPLIVLSELEGIARGVLKNEKVSEKAKFALNFLQNRCSYSNIKCVTTRGSVLQSTRFTSEEDYSKVEKNDDKILTTCLNLCKHNISCDDTSENPKKIYREVVLLTEDRNLRVKALSSNMPVQTVSDFIRWALD